MTDGAETSDDWFLAGWGERAHLDHASLLRRDTQALAKLWRKQDSRLVEFDNDGQFNAEPFGRAIVDSDGDLSESTMFLGLVDGAAWFARRVEVAQPNTFRLSVLDDTQRLVASSGLASLNWYRRSRHCVVCGGKLRRTNGGFAAVCVECSTEAFPRTDPAIICAVVNENDELFLAHEHTWPAGRVSVLAGFIEAGESVEQAVMREIGEEAQLTLSALRYVGSQPWPMPRSLMMTFVARGHGKGRVDADELTWGSWYSRERVHAEVAEKKLLLPPGISAGHQLITAWLDGALPNPEG